MTVIIGCRAFLSAASARPLEIKKRIFSRPSFGGDFVPPVIFGVLYPAPACEHTVRHGLAHLQSLAAGVDDLALGIDAVDLEHLLCKGRARWW